MQKSSATASKRKQDQENKTSRHKGETYEKEYKTANNMVRQALRNDKEKWIEKQCLSKETHPKRGNTRESFATLKNLTNKYQTPSTAIENEKGELLMEAQTIANRWKEYCQKLFNHEPPAHVDHIGSTENTCKQEESAPIKRSEIEEAVRRLKCGYAMSPLAMLVQIVLRTNNGQGSRQLRGNSFDTWEKDQQPAFRG